MFNDKIRKEIQTEQNARNMQKKTEKEKEQT